MFLSAERELAEEEARQQEEEEEEEAESSREATESTPPPLRKDDKSAFREQWVRLSTRYIRMTTRAESPYPDEVN